MLFFSDQSIRLDNIEKINYEQGHEIDMMHTNLSTQNTEIIGIEERVVDLEDKTTGMQACFVYMPSSKNDISDTIC